MLKITKISTYEALAPTWKSSKQEVSQAFQTQYLKHEVQMASKSSHVALLIF